MDFKQLLQRINSLESGIQLNEEDKKNKENQLDKVISKDADLKADEKKLKKKASEDIGDLLKALNAIVEGKKDVDEEKADEGNEFTGELAKAKASGKKEFEVDGKKYQVRETKDKTHKDEKSKDTDLKAANKSNDNEDDKDSKKDLKESILDEKAAPGQEDWIKSNKERFIKRYGKKKGLEVLYATSWKRSKSVNESAYLQEYYDRAMMGSCLEQESGMNINASTDTRTGSKSLTVTAQGDAAEQLAQLLKLSGIGHSKNPQQDAEIEETAYVNTPEPEVQGVEVQIQQGNDLHRTKNSYSKAAGGDNPMNMREFQELSKIEHHLNKELESLKIIIEKKDKPDFLDIDKDGDKKEPMKKDVKNFASTKHKELHKKVEESVELTEADLQGLIKKFGIAAVTAAALAGLGGNAQARVSLDDPGSYKVPVPAVAQTQATQSDELKNLAKFGVKTVKDLGNNFTHIQFEGRDGVFDNESNQMYFYNSKTSGLEEVNILPNGRLNTAYTSINKLGPMTLAAFQKAGITILRGSGIKTDNTSPADSAIKPNFTSQSPQNLTFTPKNASVGQ
jgi:hypothetical protein